MPTVKLSSTFLRKPSYIIRSFSLSPRGERAASEIQISYRGRVRGRSAKRQSQPIRKRFARNNERVKAAWKMVKLPFARNGGHWTGLINTAAPFRAFFFVSTPPRFPRQVRQPGALLITVSLHTWNARSSGYKSVVTPCIGLSPITQAHGGVIRDAVKGTRNFSFLERNTPRVLYPWTSPKLLLSTIAVAALLPSFPACHYVISIELLEEVSLT